MSVRLEEVTQRYGATAVVDRVTLDVAPGEMFVLLGRSGSGKSSLLRLVAGLAQPDSGRILLHGKDVTDMPPQRREAGFVFQNYSIFRHLTVAENVEFGLRIRGVARKERETRRDELLEMVELGGLGRRTPRELSGGQLQRVALARALAYRPRVLLLDEPFGALDVRIRAQLRRSLRELHDRIGVTTLLVTHDQEEAFELADRIAVIEAGRVIEVGTPQDLYARPKSGWTASFVGGGAVLLGRVRDQRAWLGPVSLEIPEDVPHEEDGWVRVLVRPEQVVLSESKPPETAATLGQGRVVARTYAGPVVRARVRLEQPPGVRQISPPLPYGEEGLIVEASVPADAALPETPWVALAGWRTLAQPPPRVLVLGRAEDAAEPFVAELCRALGAKVDRSDAPAPGSERGARFYDLAILVARADRDVERVEAELAKGVDAPVLVVPPGSRLEGPVLACTAAGEPGKASMRVGGWLARRLRRRVTLLHVWSREGDPPPWLQGHLARGLASLRAHGADGDLVVRHAPHALRGIHDQVAETGPCIVVIGASEVQHRTHGHLAWRVAHQERVPVAIVPEDAA